MKKIVVALVSFALVATVKAQEIPDRKTDAPERMERKAGMHGKGGMDLKALNLTDEQKQQVQKENQSFHAQMEDLKKNDNITVKEWREKAEALRKDHAEKMQSFLTPEQRSQMKQQKEKGQDKQKEMSKRHDEMLKEKLGLTDEQSAKMKESREEMGKKLKAIREDNTLSDDKKREEMREVFKEQKEKTKSILTQDQMEKMKEMHKKDGKGKRPEKTETTPTI